MASTPVINSVAAGELAKRNGKPTAPAYLLGAVTPVIGLFVVLPIVVYATLGVGGLFDSGGTNFGGVGAVLTALFAGVLTLAYYYAMTRITARASGVPNRAIPWTIALWLLPGIFSVAECAIALVLIFKVSVWAYLLLVVLFVPGSFFAMTAIVKAQEQRVQASTEKPDDIA